MGNSETLIELGTKDTGQRLEKTKGQIKNGQSRDTGNMGCTRHRTKVRGNQRANQEWAFPETLAILGAQDTRKRLEKT
jgi:hypothetical protein